MKDQTIKRFKDKDAYELWKGEWVARYQKIKKVAYKKLHSLINASNLNDLYLIPGNKAEELKGKRDYHSIRINDQYRIIFKWNKKGANQAEEIEINPHDKKYGK